MKNIITSVGRTILKNRSVLVRVPGLEPGQPKNIGVERQHPKNTGLDAGIMGEGTARGSRAIPPQHNSDAPKSWEQEKANIGFNADKHEMPWVAQAKKTAFNQADLTGAQKFNKSNMAQEKTNLESSNRGMNLNKDQNFGSKSKVSQASNFVKNQSTNQDQSFTEVAKDAAAEIKEQATNLKDQTIDKLSQATEFVKKQASISPTDFRNDKTEEHGVFENITGWIKEKFSGEQGQGANTNQAKQSTETFKADKDAIKDYIDAGNRVSGQSLKGQAQPKVNKEIKSEIESLIKKGTRK